MTPADPNRSPEESANRGREIYERRVCLTLTSEDHSKFVAIDVTSQEHEIDDNDYAATTRLSARRSGAEIWLLRIGQPVRLR